MTAAEFIELAEKITVMGPAGVRSASSRAYYGAYHRAIEFFGHLQIVLPKNNHAIARECLLLAKNEHASAAANDVNDLQSRRIAADYRLSDLSVVRINFGEASITLAKKAVQHLQHFSNACDQDEILKQNLIGIFRNHLKMRTRR